MFGEDSALWPVLAIGGLVVSAILAWRLPDEPGERREWFFWITFPIFTVFYFVAGLLMVGMAVAATAIAIGLGSGMGLWNEPEWLQSDEPSVSKSQPPRPSPPKKDCEPGYKDVCLDPKASDYDCGGLGNDGPKYVWEVIGVGKYDRFDLDRDGDGFGCENFAKGGSIDPNDLGEPPPDFYP